MKKITITLLSFIVLLVSDCFAQLDSIWAVAATNVHFNMGCDTIWFKMWSPIPTLENSRGKVVEITTHMEDKDADIINPKNLVPYTDSDVWLSDDRYTIFVVIRNVKRFEPNLRQGIGEFNGPFYGIQINNRFSPKKDNTPDEVLFKEHNMGYSLSRIEERAGVEEGSRLMIKEKIGNYWYAPYYVGDYQHQRGDTIINTMELSHEVELKYTEDAAPFFRDRKFLRWETEVTRNYGIEFSSPNLSSLEYTIHCGAITGETDLTITPVYSKPLSKWKLTITMDSTIQYLGGYHSYPWQPWDSTFGETEVNVSNDSTLQLTNLLADSADYFHPYYIEATERQTGLPIRAISNVPEYNRKGADGYWRLAFPDVYFHPGYDSVHIHFTRSAVNSVEENIPEAGLQQLQWQTTSERDILLKTPSLWGEGQVELYTIVGTMVQQFDVNTLSRSSEGMLLPTAGIPSGAYIVLVKSKNYRSGTVLQIIR